MILYHTLKAILCAALMVQLGTFIVSQPFPLFLFASWPVWWVLEAFYNFPFGIFREPFKDWCP